MKSIGKAKRSSLAFSVSALRFSFVRPALEGGSRPRRNALKRDFSIFDGSTRSSDVSSTMLLLVLVLLERCALGDPAPGRSPGPPAGCGLDGPAAPDLAGDDADIGVSVGHRLFDTDVLVPGLDYQVNVKRIKQGPAIAFTIKSTIDDVPIGKFINSDKEDGCSPHVFKSRIENSPVTVNWTVGTFDGSSAKNLTIELNYQLSGDSLVYVLLYTFPLAAECLLHLTQFESSVSHHDLPSSDCQVWFPSHGTGHSLVVELSRLNVPCARGYVHFSGLNVTQHPHFRSHRQNRLCGKLEELPEADRHIYFPFSRTPPVMHTHGAPVFALLYRLVDHCYNVTFVAHNGSFELKTASELRCTFKIYLPYGNRVALQLSIGDTTSTGTPSSELLPGDERPFGGCEGLFTQLHDGDNVWSHCTRRGDAERHIEMVSRTNRVVLKVEVRGGGGVGGGGALGLRMQYRAAPNDEVVGSCGFGWVSLNHFCVGAVEEAKLPWSQAEMECTRRGGHLVSIRNEHAQTVINNILVNSPGYREHNAYWIGASDRTVEGDFRWSDGLPFSYTNWFLGWPQHGHYNRQPNDDGLSEQDCVEVRRIYALPSASSSLAPAFMWNDRDCSTPNYFICERLQSNEPLDPPDCNKSVELSRHQPKAVVSSPGFPRHYPDNMDCETNITAPPGYRLVLDFEELVLENEPSCSYDYLEILENINASSSINSSSGRRLCGDWSSKLKLLRYVSNRSKLKLRFSSDYSHHFGGYKVRVSMESATQCSDDRLQMFNNSCYLFVSYPEVTWSTAQEICRGKKSQLVSISSSEEERFITTNIRKSIEYRTSALYWLGGRSEQNSDFKWIDGSAMNYVGWLPGDQADKSSDDVRCLSVQWTASSKPSVPSGLYWKSHRCSRHGGYVCKKPSQLSGIGFNFNKTLNGSEGTLTSPHYPENYLNQLDFSVRITGPDRTRLVLKFQKIDVEPQVECLYDFVELSSGKGSDAVRFCGSHDTDMDRFNFVSAGNEAHLKFHSDYSISGSGFQLSWQAVDVSACPLQSLTAKEGIINSPNYPDFLLANLDCTLTILAPSGKRVWLDFLDYDVERNMQDTLSKEAENFLELTLGKDIPQPFRPFETENLLTEGSFLSTDERLKIRLRTGKRPSGRGFRAIYRIISSASEKKIINLRHNTTGMLLHLNYPANPPSNVNFLQHFVAPIGSVISLELFGVKFSDAKCPDESGILEVYDNYYDSNGTWWRLCYDANIEDSIVPVTPMFITSFLNSLHLRQRSSSVGIALNGSLRVQEDPQFKVKLLSFRDEEVETCNPNPCRNGGKCVTKKNRHFCQCAGHFTGLFCALTKCDLEPCVFGTCELTNSSYKCHCKKGYIGPTCEQKKKPCEGNPCESRGVCIERGDGFICRCHAWWEGPRCEKKMQHIPYKPLSERMFHEPFWLGLMTVCVVMGVIGLVWCAKRHFPEKIEKLLAEENDRNRSTMSSLRSSSVREQLAVTSGGGSTTVNPSPGLAAPRSLFGRLGIRKPSILSLTSPHAGGGYVPATARTFSLDDLLKPPPRRTPSPKKKRNNSTPTKKNAAEKKQILQQLISPGNKQLSRKVSLGELMQLSERKPSQPKASEPKVKETKLVASSEADSLQSALNDPKLEKKVTFARLLNRVSAEMSSGSELELGVMQSGRLGCAWVRPSSTPPSPNADARSPNSTSSNQGSDSFTSSDLAIPSALSCSISDLLGKNKAGRLNRQKPASADSILAMFKNFSSSSAGANLSPSLKVSPSTTPTASSPQDDVAGDDESSTSSIHTPVSFSSGPPESPIMHRHSTIEVPVLDPLSAHKAAGAGANLLHPPTILLEIPSTINKCLSPIRELPTPLPSPALTPVMRRSAPAIQEPAPEGDTSDDGASVDLPHVSISDGDDDDEMPRKQDIVIDLHAEDGLIMEEAAAMQQQVKNRPKALGSEAPQPLVIPMLTIQTPSPTHSRAPTLILPGSPPPHKSHLSQESSFPFPASKQNRKFFKDFDKPNSLDLPCAPPMITITCNMSEAESDAESMSPANKGTVHLGVNPGGMSYLSPFSIGARGEHNASESNLSSSGYSSMASPGPSRCGSSNPLCPSEMEDQGPPGSGTTRRRSSATLRTIPSPNEKSEEKTQEQRRGRSDSETLSDDPLLESNDEGIGTDHIDEKIEDGDLKSAKELEVFITEGDTKTVLDVLMPAPARPGKGLLEETMEKFLPVLPGKSTLQLPSIVVQCEHSGCEKAASPISSRSESPLSDRSAGMGRFSPQFYGRNKDLLPFTDSDGLYDFPSTDKMNVMCGTQHKKTGRKRDKKLLRNCKTPSPTKSTNPLLPHGTHLDVPNKDSFYKVPPPRKLSPKRRVPRSHLVSSSSSSDSINSAREVRMSSSSPSPETIRWSSPIDWLDEKSQLKSNEDVTSSMLPKPSEPFKQNKISKLRAISHQIRRLEQSLKRRERTISPSDSLDSGGDEDSPRATSPLLQPSKTPKVEIRKSHSIGKIQTKAKKGKCKRGGEMLLPQEDEGCWKRVVISGSGHSD